MNSLASLEPAWALLIGAVVVALLILGLWPGWGLLSRIRRSQDVLVRVHAEDALKHYYNLELQGRRPTLQSLAGSLEVTLSRAADVLSHLQRRELVTLRGDEIHLTSTGRRYALSVVRAHRLWEQHLAEQTGVPESEWHRQADRQEHFISPGQADALSARLGHPAFDPHGDPIPTAQGELAPTGGRPLSVLEPNQWGRVLHVEDEPESVYAQIRALGIYPGMMVQLLETSPQRVRLWADGEEHVLAPIVAANISVQAVSMKPEVESRVGGRLSDLKPGDSGKVARISPRCRGPERRRLLDLGILPGTMVTAEIESPAGNLMAYRVRGTLIALRSEQAGLVQVEPPERRAV